MESIVDFGYAPLVRLNKLLRREKAIIQGCSDVV